jgi:hypothetical protein
MVSESRQHRGIFTNSRAHELRGTQRIAGQFLPPGEKIPLKARERVGSHQGIPRLGKRILFQILACGLRWSCRGGVSQAANCR